MADVLDIDEQEIKDALRDVLRSEAFVSSPRLTSLLSYIVEETLAGRADGIKAYTIGLDVLNKSQDFDPSTDPIVRVQAGRLRQALVGYYATEEGSAAALRIDVPKGGYAPVFEVRETPKVTPAKLRRHHWYALAGVAALALLAFLILPRSAAPVDQALDAAATDRIVVSIQNMTSVPSDPDTTALADQLSEELLVLLTRNRTLAVFDQRDPTPITDSDFLLGGTVQKLPVGYRVNFDLKNARTGRLIWARSNETDGPGTTTDQMLEDTIRELHPQFFGAVKAALEGREPAKLSAWQLYVMSTWVPGEAVSALEWEIERKRLASMAVEKDPEFGPAHSVLADKMIYLSSVDATYHSEEAETLARMHADKALQLAPQDGDTMFNVAIYQWHAGDMAKATLAMDRVVELNPNHGMAALLADVFPYTCSASPDEVLDIAAKFDASLTPDNPVRWVTQTWLGMLHLNRGTLMQALDAEEKAAQIFQTPDTVMRHAAILAALGRDAEAVALIETQRSNWPNLDPAHFAEVTLPRRCHEDDQAAPLIAAYTHLAKVWLAR